MKQAKAATVTTVQTRARHNYYIAPFGKANFGPGGRSSSSGITATVFGGYGFVGRYFMSELGKCSFSSSSLGDLKSIRCHLFAFDFP